MRPKIIYIFLLVFIVQFIFSQPKEKQVKWSGVISKKELKTGEKAEIKINADIKTGWHLYSTTTPPEGAQPTKFRIKESELFKLAGSVSQTKPIIKYEESFGTNTEFYEKEASFTFNIEPTQKVKNGPNDITVVVEYMMCNDKFCLPPVEDEIKLKVNVTKVETKTDLVESDEKTKETKDTSKTIVNNVKSDSIKKSSEGLRSFIPMNVSNDIDEAKSKGLFSFIGFSMTMGLLALLTPCVFPMVPITVSFFTKREQKSRKQGVKDALIYSFGIIFTFVVLGFLLALLLGASGINQFAANPWVNLGIAGIFILFALNLFGLFEIALPSSLLTKLNKSSTGKSGTISILLMGLTFSLTSFTCTVPFIGTIMVAAANGDFLWPIIGMLAYSIVFALPFFLLALFPMFLKSIPRSGGWLNAVKVTMGFLEIAAAMKFLSNTDLVWRCGILTFDFFLSGWVAISLLIVIYLLGKIRLPHDTPVESIGVIRLLFAMLFLTIGIYLSTGLIGTRLGELDAFLPPREYPGTIAASFVRGANSQSELVWLDDYQKALKQAKEMNKKIFIDFTGYTCTNCRWMEANVFSNSKVKELFGNYIIVRLYTDGIGDIYKKNRKMQEERFGTIALPFYVIMSNEDKAVADFPGLTRDLNEFITFLDKNK
jgi:thiol:disulfide interchange protein